jgi:hypothetical protein
MRGSGEMRWRVRVAAQAAIEPVTGHGRGANLDEAAGGGGAWEYDLGSSGGHGIMQGIWLHLGFLLDVRMRFFVF